MGYENALSLAWENLLKLDPSQIARLSETKYISSQKKILVDFLNGKFIIDLDKKLVFYGSLEVKSKDFISILILHYLIGIKDIPLSGEKISFKNLPGGDFYFPAFRQNCLIPLIRNFSDNPRGLLENAKYLEGQDVLAGDAGIEIRAFKKFPITVVVWGKDSEFSAEANILYDRTAKDFLPTEDIVMASSLTVGKLIKKGG